MKAISGEKFISLINEDPDFCKKLKAPLEISNPCHLIGSSVSELSPYLIFKKSTKSKFLLIDGCHNLKTISGTFEVAPYIIKCSNLKSINNIDSCSPTVKRTALYVEECLELRSISGIIKEGISLKLVKNCSLSALRRPQDSNWYHVSLANIQGQITFPLSIPLENISGDEIQKEKHCNRITNIKKLKQSEEIEI